MFYTVGTSPCIHSFVGMHTHQFYEIIVNTKGVGTYSIKGKKFLFNKGASPSFPQE